MITAIITAFNEPTTITKALKYIVNPDFSGFRKNLQVIQISPDEETLEKASKYISTIKNPKLEYLQIKDEQLGKPHALNVGLKRAKSDIVVLTDGDVHFTESSFVNLIEEFKKRKLDVACGKVISKNSTKTLTGYISHLMTSAAHHKRLIELSGKTEGYGTKLVHKTNFFPLSGYMLIFNKKKLEQVLGEGFVFPTDCLVEDAYLSYVAYNYGLKLGYIPQARVYAKFPSNLSDYFKQKKRSTGGYLQLWKYGVIKKETNARSFWQELRYFWYPFKFAKSLRDIIYSLIYFPIRLYLWLMMWWERKILKKDFIKTWVRIESTK
ncbi:glycosyltransferase [Candidatus Dojkabacteria bacterium]|nr:glycosyltransferase [Candidatus Dojkabacteria bacterium]